MTKSATPRVALTTPQERLDAKALRAGITSLEEKVAELTLKMLTAGLNETAPVGQLSDWANAVQAACQVITTLLAELREQQ